MRRVGAASEERRFLGVRVSPLSMAQVVERCEKAANAREGLVIGVVNAAKIVKMGQAEELRDAVLGADLVIPDGMAVVWASRILGEPLSERVAGIDLFEELLGLAERGGFSVYFLGATDDVLARMLARLRQRHPKLRVAGSRNGYFPDDGAHAVAQEIRSAQPDFLFVGISTPKKEKFLAAWGAHMDVGVCHGVGGAFDVVAGKVTRAPSWMQRTGLEWLYRVIQEPRRMWKRYLVTNTLFIGRVIGEWWRRRTGAALEKPPPAAPPQ